MNAALRVAWTFFTALPLQRWLGSSGVVLGGLLAIAGVVVQEPPLWTFGLLVVLIVAAFPTLFAGPAVFRALSATRANQLLPRFRARMLAAVALFVAALVGMFAVLLFALASLGDRALPVEPLFYAFAFVAAAFVLMFLQYGDWRWIWLWVGTAVGFSLLSALPVTRSWLAAIPSWAWLVAALAAWVAFAIWYVRARRIAPLALVPQPHARAWSGVDLDGLLTRESALRALVTAQPPRSRKRVDLPRTVIGVGLITAVIVASVTLPFTSALWPFATMMLCWSKATSIVHRSRLLWLRIPGARAAVRREVERALLRNLGGALLVLLGVAALYGGSPLVAAPPHQVLAGFVLAASAGLFATYAALAAIPGNAVHLVTFALLILAQFGLLAPPSPSLTDAVVVTAIELIGAMAFRAFAVARWRRVDWLRLRPLAQSNVFRDA